MNCQGRNTELEGRADTFYHARLCDREVLEHISTLLNHLMEPNQPIGGVAKLARSTRSRYVLRLAEWTDLTHQIILYDREVL